MRVNELFLENDESHLPGFLQSKLKNRGNTSNPQDSYREPEPEPVEPDNSEKKLPGFLQSKLKNQGNTTTPQDSLRAQYLDEPHTAEPDASPSKADNKSTTTYPATGNYYQPTGDYYNQKPSNSSDVSWKQSNNVTAPSVTPTQVSIDKQDDIQYELRRSKRDWERVWKLAQKIKQNQYVSDAELRADIVAMKRVHNDNKTLHKNASKEYFNDFKDCVVTIAQYATDIDNHGDNSYQNNSYDSNHSFTEPEKSGWETGRDEAKQWADNREMNKKIDRYETARFKVDKRIGDGYVTRWNHQSSLNIRDVLDQIYRVAEQDHYDPFRGLDMSDVEDYVNLHNQGIRTRSGY